MRPNKKKQAQDWAWQRVSVGMLQLTSQVAALFQVVDSFAVVAFAELLAHQSSHHDLHPLLPDDGVLGGLQRLVVVVVNAIERGRDLGLLGQESLGFGSRHLLLLD